MKLNDVVCSFFLFHHVSLVREQEKEREREEQTGSPKRNMTDESHQQRNALLCIAATDKVLSAWLKVVLCRVFRCKWQKRKVKGGFEHLG